MEKLKNDPFYIFPGMKNFLKEILADPITGENLSEDKNHGQDVFSSGEAIYPIIDNVPLLLPKQKLNDVVSNLHTQFHSVFDYAAHYKEDAQQNDYFQERESSASREETRREHQAVIKRIPEKAGLILDVGCGNGWVANHFLKKGKKVISMDISTKNPTRVLKENPNENHAAIVADVFHLPFKKNSMDVIIASEIMEHVYDPGLFVQKLLEVLKPGGKLIIITPYNEKIEYNLCVHCNRPTPRNAHLHSFNENNITTFIPNEGVDYKTENFSNKYLVRLRFYLLLSFLPYRIWRFTDLVANSIFKKSTFFLIELNKKSTSE